MQIGVRIRIHLAKRGFFIASLFRMTFDTRLLAGEGDRVRENPPFTPFFLYKMLLKKNGYQIVLLPPPDYQFCSANLEKKQC